jgi:hypothetical protein
MPSTPKYPTDYESYLHTAHHRGRLLLHLLHFDQIGLLRGEEERLLRNQQEGLLQALSSSGR